MAQLKLDAQLTVAGKFIVGANPQPPNSFDLTVTNAGSDLKVADGPLELLLTGSFGSSEDALFLNDADAKNCDRTLSSEDWKVTWSFALDANPKTFTLKMVTARNPLLKQNESVKLTLSKVVSKTAPGPAKLRFLAKLGKTAAQQQQTQEFSIVKNADNPQILAFYSDPPEGVQNLPGSKVILHWRTYKLGNRKLFQLGVSDPLAANFTKDEGSYTVHSVTKSVSFKLSGDPPPDERTLTIGVLTPGWYDLKNIVSEGDPGYPEPVADEDGKFMSIPPEIELEPVELFNANNQLLYGTFRYKLQDVEGAFLFQAENPFARWRMVKTDSGDNAAIPPGFSTSPGIYFDDKVWLIGGSQIDPDLTSNKFCYFDTGKKVWQPAQTAPWRARMGHAVLYFQGKIWLMGGRDAFGNALKDVWVCDAAGKWDAKSDAEWTSRCLFRPVVYNDKIWLYGGMKEPFSSQLYNDSYRYPSSSGKWEKLDLTGILGDRKPVASSLEVFKNELRLFGKFRSIGGASELVEPLAFSLSSPDTTAWQPFAVEGLKDWGGVNTFNCQVVNFSNKMLLAKALAYDQPNTVLKIFVPSS